MTSATAWSAGPVEGRCRPRSPRSSARSTNRDPSRDSAVGHAARGVVSGHRPQTAGVWVRDARGSRRSGGRDGDARVRRDRRLARRRDQRRDLGQRSADRGRHGSPGDHACGSDCGGRAGWIRRRGRRGRRRCGCRRWRSRGGSPDGRAGIRLADDVADDDHRYRHDLGWPERPAAGQARVHDRPLGPRLQPVVQHLERLPERRPPPRGRTDRQLLRGRGFAAGKRDRAGRAVRGRPSTPPRTARSSRASTTPARAPGDR